MARDAGDIFIGAQAMKTGPAFLLSMFLVLAMVGRAWAQRSSVDFPVYSNGGKPDLTVDPKRFVSQMAIVDRYFDPASCDLVEGTVGGSGYRRILRFDVVVINGGDGDLDVGSPIDGPYASHYLFSPCHGHYHLQNYSVYELLTLDGQLVVPGHKQGFCFEGS